MVPVSGPIDRQARRASPRRGGCGWPYGPGRRWAVQRRERQRQQGLQRRCPVLPRDDPDRGEREVVRFDYNGNGRIDFADVVWLFNLLSPFFSGTTARPHPSSPRAAHSRSCPPPPRSTGRGSSLPRGGRPGKKSAGRPRSFSTRDAIYPIMRPRSLPELSVAPGITGQRPSRRSGPANIEGAAPPPDRTSPSTPEPDQCATSSPKRTSAIGIRS